MSTRADKIEKLRRLTASDNPHEAERAREAVARLSHGVLLERPSDRELGLTYLGTVNGTRHYRMGPAVAKAPNGQLPGSWRHPRGLRGKR